MDTKEVEARFFDVVKDHKLTIIRSSENSRHLEFRKPGTGCYGFDIITWPWHLCITGYWGAFLFRRLEDMFDFFRMNDQIKRFSTKNGNKLYINKVYWHKKVLAESRNGGCKKYSEEVFRSEIKRWFDDWAEDQPNDLAMEVWSKIEDEVLTRCENRYDAMAAALSFRHENFDFDDFWTVDLEEYTNSFVWCLYAIVWGISVYDEIRFNCVLNGI